MKPPLISFMIMCRITTALNDGSVPSLTTLLDSAVQFIHEKDRDRVEFLIRFDLDDPEAIKQVQEAKLLDKYPFKITTMYHHRWEGLMSSHFTYTSLFLRKHPESRYVAWVTDDAKFYDFSDGIIPQLDECKKEFISFSLNSRNHRKDKLDKVIDYKNTQDFWGGGEMTEPYPIVSSKVYEICSLIGFHRNVDNWFTLLNVILYSKYGITINEALKSTFLVRTNTTAEDMIYGSYLKTRFNFDITGMGIIPHDSYYFKLVEQQATNIYLNIKAKNALEQYKFEEKK